MQDALASNAGDRYHFVYAARRMLDMLPPQSNLEKIVMEGVTKEDLLLEDREETFLVVDLTEYYGGQDSNDADNIVVVQVKYSPTNPDGKWTLNRLCANKAGKSGTPKPGTSILRKLSNVFNFFYGKLGNNTVEKVKIKLHSNQPLDDKLKNHLLEIREMVVKKNNSEGVKHLKNASGELREIISRIKETANLPWIRLSMFLKCLDLNEFGQAMLSVVESELFNKSSAFRSDNHVYVDGLISFVQEHAVPNRPTEITKKSVYALLRLREIDFFPAPTDFPELENPIFTKTAAHVIEKIESMHSGILIVHGISGTGKSTLVQLISQKHGGGKSAVLYDCFAGGAGLKAGNERFPYTKCFVQIINDLDALFYTNILATTQLKYDHLMRQFNKALSEASQIALKLGNRLVVAIDAVDNAVEAASRAPIKSAESFVPIIWQLEFPENCIFVVTARTENIPTLKIEGEYESFEIEGFTFKETGDYIRSSWKDADDDLIKHIYKRTKGNPRVQSKLLEDAKRNHPKNFIDFVSEKAKETVFEYYKTECPKRVNSEDKILLLAVLFETAPSISIQTLSKIMERSVGNIHSTIESLYFGLRITGNNEITWIDQDFFDFTKEYTANQKEQSCSILAEYCRYNYGRCNFATANISHCFYNAGWYKELLNWWISENHLTSRIEEVSPHEEDVLRDVRYTLLAAQKTEQFADALKLLGLSADILQGRDVFSSILKDHPVIAIRSNYLDRLLDYLEGKKEDLELAGYYISIGRALSENHEQKERAEELIHRGFTIIIQENQKYPRGERGFNIENIRDITLYNANIHSLEIALKKMQRWTPQENVYPVFAMVTRIWATRGCEESIKTIKMIELNDYQRAYSLLGVISSEKAQLSREILYEAAQTVLKYIKDNIIDCNEINDMIPGIVENLLSQKLIKIAKLFIPYWKEPKISSRIDFKREIPGFLRKKAVETIMNIKKFNPDEFKYDKTENNGHGYHYDLDIVRSIMKKLFPAILIRVKTLIGGITEESNITQIQKSLEFWLENVKHWQAELRFSYINAACNLLEAITYMEGFHKDIVRKICDTSKHVLPDPYIKGYHEYADILAKDERYLFMAEKLIERRRQEICTVDYTARDRVDALLFLYGVAYRFDQKLAENLFMEARRAACYWEGNVEGLATALVKTSIHAKKGTDIKNEQLVKLSIVFEHMKKLAFDEANTRLDELLRFISSINPSIAFDYLKRLDLSNLFNFIEGIGPIGLGILDTQSLSPSVVWPLTHIEYSYEKGLELFYHAASQMIDQSSELKHLLHQFSRYIKKKVPKHLIIEEAQKLCKWATEHNLENNAEIHALQQFAKTLNQWGVNKEKTSYQYSDKQEKISPLFNVFLDNIKTNPSCALDILTKASIQEVAQLNRGEIKRVVSDTLEIIPSSKVSQLIDFIEIWAADHWWQDSIILFEEIIKKKQLPNDVLNRIKISFQELLEPEVIHRMVQMRDYGEKYLDIILQCPKMDIKIRFDIFLMAISRSLWKFDSDTLYRMIGYLSELLQPTQSFDLFEMLLEKSFNKVPQEYTSHLKLENDYKPLDALVKFLSNYLGHSRQSIRWKVLYSLVDMALNMPDPVLKILTNELRDDKHARWMTKREWLLFVLHHLSLKISSPLKLYADVFIKIALDKSFPHAKMRYHAKEILLNIEKRNQGALDPDVLKEIQNINEPRELLPREKVGDNGIPYKGTRWWEKQDTVFTINDIDTLKYWYGQLSYCFAMHRCHVADIAYKWIVNKWSITNEKCSEDEKRNDRNYDWKETSNDHGSEPAVETLHLYAERHAMFMAAGELIDSYPVLFEGEREGDRWHEWTRYDLREADPALTGKLIDSPPLYLENYGVFNSDYEIWVKKDVEEDFKKEFFINNMLDWVVASGNRNGSFSKRQFNAEVRSALVSRETSNALARLICSQSEIINLPYINASLDTIITEFEEDLDKQSDYYICPKNGIIKEEEIFELKDWLIYWHQEMPFHSFDPKWPSFSRNYFFPGKDFCKKLALYREPTSLVWKDKNGKKVAYHENWYDYKGWHESSDYTEGFRLIVRRDALCKYLREIGLNMIFEVNLRRQKAYSYRRDGGNEYDRGTRKAYILTGEGDLK